MGDLIERLKGLQEWKAAAYKNRTARCGFTACMTKKRATDEGEEWGYVNLGDVMGVAEEAADELARLRAEVEGLRESLHYANGTCELAMKHRDEAERDRDDLRRRIAEAPAFTLTWVDGREWRSHDVPDVAHADISGQRVALVRLDAEEGK